MLWDVSSVMDFPYAVHNSLSLRLERETLADICAWMLNVDEVTRQLLVLAMDSETILENDRTIR